MRYEVTRHCALHEGGTKFYQQVRIEQPDLGKALLIQHWGPFKRSYDLSQGQRKVLKVDCYQARTEYQNKWDAKSKRGYKVEDIKNLKPADTEELGVALQAMGADTSQIAGIQDYFDKGRKARAPVSMVCKVSDIPETEGWGTW